MVAIFSDISFDPTSRTGISGILVVEDSQLKKFDDTLVVQLTLHHATACTQLEINSVIAAMDIVKKDRPATASIYTDCKTAIDLPRRRAKLEANSYISKAKGEEHQHANLYRLFFRLLDQTTPTLTWIKGHKAASEKSVIDSYFSHVDQACRRALRAHLAEV